MKTSIDIHNYLNAKGIEHEIFPTSKPVKSIKEASAILGLKPEEMVKCILVKAASLKKVAQHLKAKKVGLATPEETVKVTGYRLGTTPPCDFLNKIPCLIDQKVMEKEVIYTGAGEPTNFLKIKSSDVLRLTEGEVADIAHR
jgi:prolyl-tRNA editing enzyme YbaK/EbsC (Cys-tRNA(Pro) deacylase)